MLRCVATQTKGFKPPAKQNVAGSECVDVTPCSMSPLHVVKPAFPVALNSRQRCELFGRFAYKPDPTKSNPEHILVTDTWAKENLVKISLGPLAAAQGADEAVFHKLVAPRFEELVAAWVAEGVSEDVLQWGGSYAARFIRGKMGVLSAHAWGSAFDINPRWNGLGKIPAPEGAHGSVRRLVPAAERLGWAWGGRFRRQDGMHFELARL